MSDLNYPQVTNLRLSMHTERSPFMKKWENAGELMSPRRFNQNPSRRNRGENKEQKIINGVQRRALRTFVSGMMNGATPRSREWFRLSTLSEKKRSISGVKRHFRELEQILNAHFQIGNLYRVLPSSYKDLGVFSNSAFGMLPHPEFGFYFFPFAMGTYGIASDSEGNTNMFFRDFVLTVRQIVETYLPVKTTGHIDWTGVDPWIRSMWESARYNEQAILSNVIVPNPSPKADAFFPRDMRYQSYTYMNGLGGAVGSQTQSARSLPASNAAGGFVDEFLSIKGYDYFPVIAPRWEVAPESDWGDEGPGEIALGDILTLQEMEKDRLEGAQKLVRPPFVGPSSLRRHQASILAGGITYVDEMQPGKQFRPAFSVDPRLAELIATHADYKEAIRSSFFEDLFLMLASEKPISHVTKEEIQQRQAEKLSAIGPVLGQLDQDQNRRIIDNALFILEQQKRLPERPKELEGEQFQVEYVNILAQAQKSSSVVSIERFLNFASGAANVLQDPALLGIVRGEQMLRQYADGIGVDPRLIADESEYKKMREAIAQAQQQAAQREAQAQQAATAKDATQAQAQQQAIG